MAKDAGTPSRFSNYLMKLLMESTRSQKEIAEDVGFRNQNMITMLKLGHVKLALDRVPAMAKALRVDPVDMFKLALTQFYDDASCRLLTELMEQGISEEERKILRIVREEVGENTLTLSGAQEKALRKVFATKP